MKPSPEAVRAGVARMKRLSRLRIPNYELPADSFLEECVVDIIVGDPKEEKDQYHNDLRIAVMKALQDTAADADYIDIERMLTAIRPFLRIQ